MGHQLMESNDLLVDRTRELAKKSVALETVCARLEGEAMLRDQFVATLSHDLRSPLTATALLATTLRRRARSASPDEIDRQTAKLVRNLERILELVDHVLAATRLEANAMAKERAPVSLTEVGTSVLEVLEPAASEASVRLELAAREQVKVMGDRVQLFQVFENLVGNAMRYSPPGDVVTISIEANATQVRCAVRDRGPGVPAELRSTIFDRFRSMGSKPGAAGLGLYIARQIVELHGGRIWLEPCSLGACFTFELPIAA
jgi:signal transduction histidine kinase